MFILWVEKINDSNEKGLATELIFKQENISDGIKKIFNYGTVEENYISDKNSQFIQGIDNKKICEIKFPESELTKQEQKKKLQEAIKSVGIQSESFYLLDHILLRPNEKLKAFGYKVYVNNDIVFYSP